MELVWTSYEAPGEYSIAMSRWFNSAARPCDDERLSRRPTRTGTAARTTEQSDHEARPPARAHLYRRSIYRPERRARASRERTHIRAAAIGDQ
jgi:hypothetical protein